MMRAGGARVGKHASGSGQLIVVRWPIAKLKQDAHNARRHPPASLAAIRASLQAFGQQKPIVVAKDGTVVAGNGQLEAARALGWTELDVVVTQLSGARARAFALADNRTAELSEWDSEALRAAVASLRKEDDGLLAATGFNADDLLEQLAAGERPPVDAAPKVDQAAALARKWQVKLGDVWELGDHRITCGDSTDASVVARVLAGDVPPIMVTDPPYGVEYDASWRNEAGVSKSKQTGKVENDDRASWSSAWRLFPGDVAYVWHAARFAGVVDRSLVACGFDVRAQIIWVKPRFALSRGHYHWRHEPCLYATRRGATGSWVGGRKQDTVWSAIVDAWPPKESLFAAQVDAETVYAFDAASTTVWEISHDKAAGGGHSTQKPVECMARPIRNHGKAGDLVYEPFSGSGTTIIACEQTGRRCRAIEISPGYVAVALQRWADATGKRPKKV